MTTDRRVRPPALLGPPVIDRWGLVPVGVSRRDIRVHTQYPVSVNPVLEPPRDDVQSLRQPISVAGFHRWARTGMSVPSLAMHERAVAHVGHFVGHNSNRAAMHGVPTRPWTYKQTPPLTGPGPGRVQSIQNG